MSPDRGRPLMLAADGDEDALAGLELQLRRAAVAAVSAIDRERALQLALEPNLALIGLTTPNYTAELVAGVRAALERRMRPRFVSRRGGRPRTG